MNTKIVVQFFLFFLFCFGNTLSAQSKTRSYYDFKSKEIEVKLVLFAKNFSNTDPTRNISLLLDSYQEGQRFYAIQKEETSDIRIYNLALRIGAIYALKNNKSSARYYLKEAFNAEEDLYSKHSESLILDENQFSQMGKRTKEILTYQCIVNSEEGSFNECFRAWLWFDDDYCKKVLNQLCPNEKFRELRLSPENRKKYTSKYGNLERGDFQ